jgi:hypothetical protein
MVSDLEPGARTDVTARCPTCGSEDVKDMGLGFSPPRDSRVKEWRLLAAAARDGKSFLCCCSTAQPATLLEFRELLSQPTNYLKMVKKR